MTIDPWVREILRCPACVAPLMDVRSGVPTGGVGVPTGGAGVPTGGGGVPAGQLEALRCEECGRSYPVEDGMPVLLIDHADAPAAPEAGSAHVSDSASADAD